MRQAALSQPPPSRVRLYPQNQAGGRVPRRTRGSRASLLVADALPEVPGGGSASISFGTRLLFPHHRSRFQPRTSPPVSLKLVLWHLVSAGGVILFATLDFISNIWLRVLICCKQVPRQVSTVKSICLLMLLKSEKAVILKNFLR